MLKVQLARWGVDIVTTAKLLGHASIATIHCYVRANPERLMAAVEANPLARRDNTSPVRD